MVERRRLRFAVDVRVDLFGAAVPNEFNAYCMATWNNNFRRRCTRHRSLHPPWFAAPTLQAGAAFADN